MSGRKIRGSEFSYLAMGHATPAQHPDPDKAATTGFASSVLVGTGTLLGGTATFAKVVDPHVVGVRWVAKPDGDLVLQFGRAWTRGFTEHGVDWEDVPVVGGSFA